MSADGKYLLAIDQGTSSSRAVLYDHETRVVASAQQEFASVSDDIDVLATVFQDSSGRQLIDVQEFVRIEQRMAQVGQTL